MGEEPEVRVLGLRDYKRYSFLKQILIEDIMAFLA